MFADVCHIGAKYDVPLIYSINSLAKILTLHPKQALSFVKKVPTLPTI